MLPAVWVISSQLTNATDAPASSPALFDDGRGQRSFFITLDTTLVWTLGNKHFQLCFRGVYGQQFKIAISFMNTNFTLF